MEKLTQPIRVSDEDSARIAALKPGRGLPKSAFTEQELATLATLDSASEQSQSMLERVRARQLAKVAQAPKGTGVA